MPTQVWHTRGHIVCCHVNSFSSRKWGKIPYLSFSRADSSWCFLDFPNSGILLSASTAPCWWFFSVQIFLLLSVFLPLCYRAPSILLNTYWEGEDKSASWLVIFGHSNKSNDNNVNNSSLHVLRTYYVPVTVLSALHVMINLLLTAALWRGINENPQFERWED